MKLPPKYVRSIRDGHSLKLVPTLALAVIGLFCGSPSAFATPLLGSALASFAVLGKAGITNVPKSKISGTLSPAQNILVGQEYTVEPFNVVTTLVRPEISSYQADYTFVGPIVDIGSDFTSPILPATGFESSGGFDQAANIQLVAAIPEPATLALLGLGLAGLGYARRRAETNSSSADAY